MRYIALATGQFAMVSSTFMLAGSLTLIADHFAISIAAAALSISLFSLSYALSAPFLTLLTARFEPKLIVLGSLALFASANFATTMVTSYDALLVLRVVAACADGVYAATGNALALAMAPPRMRGRKLAVVNFGATLALLIGVPTTTYFAAQYGWQTVFYFVGGAAALAGAILAILLPTGMPRSTATLGQRVGILRTPHVLPTLFVTLASYAGLLVVYNFSQPLLQRSGLEALVSVPSLLMTFGLAAIAGNLAGGFLNDAIGTSRTIVISLAGLGITLLGIEFFFARATTVFLFYFAIGFLHFMALTPIQNRLSLLAGEGAASALAFNAAAMHFGLAAAAQAGGWLLDRSDTLLPIGLLGAALKFMALALFLRTLRARRTLARAE